MDQPKPNPLENDSLEPQALTAQDDPVGAAPVDSNRRPLKIFALVLLVVALLAGLGALFYYLVWPTLSAPAAPQTQALPDLNPVEQIGESTLIRRDEQTSAAVFRLRNNNKRYGLRDFHLTIRLYDEQEKLVTEHTVTASFLPEQDRYLVVPVTNPKVTQAQIFIPVQTGSFVEDQYGHDVSVQTVNLSGTSDNDSYTLNADLVNNSPFGLQRVTVVFLVRNPAGQLMAAGSSLYNLRHDETKKIFFAWPQNLPDNVIPEVRVYAESFSESDLFLDNED